MSKGPVYFFKLWGRNFAGTFTLWGGVIKKNPVIGIPLTLILGIPLMAVSPLTSFLKTCIDYATRRPLSSAKLDKIQKAKKVEVSEPVEIRESPEFVPKSAPQDIKAQLKDFNAMPAFEKFDAVIDEMDAGAFGNLVDNIQMYKRTMFFSSNATGKLLFELKPGMHKGGQESGSIVLKTYLKNYLNAEKNQYKGLYAHISGLLFSKVNQGGIMMTVPKNIKSLGLT